MANTINSLDERLVTLLGVDAQQNSETLAKKLKVSSATVRRRLNKLLQDQLVHIVAVADPRDFGYPLASIIALDVSHENIKSDLELLSNWSEIRWVSTCTGRFDIIAIGRFHSTGDLSDFMTTKLTKLIGLKDSETFICLDVHKGNNVVLT